MEKTKDNRKFFSMPDPKFQKEFVGLMVFVTLSAVLIMMVGTYFMTEKFVMLASQLPTMSGNIEGEVSSQMHGIWWLMIGACLVNCVGNAVFGFWFSKRTSGIVFRVTRDLNRWLDGEKVPKIVPREGDFFIPMVDTVNRVMEKDRN